MNFQKLSLMFLLSLNVVFLFSPSCGVYRSSVPYSLYFFLIEHFNAKYLNYIYEFYLGNGNWGNWGSFTNCVFGTGSTCGFGKQNKTRECNSPAPSGGDDCLEVNNVIRSLVETIEADCYLACPGKFLILIKITSNFSLPFAF